MIWLQLWGMNRIEFLAAHFQLLPHPEGGFYKENYRSKQLLQPQGFAGERAYATAIYFLLTTAGFSAFHRIKSDEGWHFYEGAALNVHVIHPDGQYQLLKLGGNLQAGQVYQATVPAGSWFASEVTENGHYAFVGCTVAPGFSFEDFELAEQAALVRQFPQHAPLIGRLTRA